MSNQVANETGSYKTSRSPKFILNGIKEFGQWCRNTSDTLTGFNKPGNICLNIKDWPDHTPEKVYEMPTRPMTTEVPRLRDPNDPSSVELVVVACDQPHHANAYERQKEEMMNNRKKFVKTNGELFEYLATTISPTMKLRIDQCKGKPYETARNLGDGIQLFKLIIKTCREIAYDDSNELRTMLINYKYDGVSSIREYFQEFDDMVEQLSHAGTVLTNNDLITTLRNCLPIIQFEPIVRELFHSTNTAENPYPKYEDIKQTLMTREDNIKRREPLTVKSPPTARAPVREANQFDDLNATLKSMKVNFANQIKQALNDNAAELLLRDTRGNHKSYDRGGNNNNNKRPRDNGEWICYYCGSQHERRNCELTADQRRAVSCTVCKTTGHHCTNAHDEVAKSKKGLPSTQKNGKPPSKFQKPRAGNNKGARVRMMRVKNTSTPSTNINKSAVFPATYNQYSHEEEFVAGNPERLKLDMLPAHIEEQHELKYRHVFSYSAFVHWYIEVEGYNNGLLNLERAVIPPPDKWYELKDRNGMLDCYMIEHLLVNFYRVSYPNPILMSVKLPWNVLYNLYATATNCTPHNDEHRFKVPYCAINNRALLTNEEIHILNRSGIIMYDIITAQDEYNNVLCPSKYTNVKTDNATSGTKATNMYSDVHLLVEQFPHDGILDPTTHLIVRDTEHKELQYDMYVYCGESHWDSTAVNAVSRFTANYVKICRDDFEQQYGSNPHIYIKRTITIDNGETEEVLIQLSGINMACKALAFMVARSARFSISTDVHPRNPVIKPLDSAIIRKRKICPPSTNVMHATKRKPTITAKVNFNHNEDEDDKSKEEEEVYNDIDSDGVITPPLINDLNEEEVVMTSPKKPTTHSTSSNAIALQMRTKRKIAQQVALRTGEFLVVDSGATKSVEMSTKYTPNAIVNNDPELVIEVLGGMNLPVSHTGVMPGTGEYLVCEYATENLMSVKQAAKNGISSNFIVDEFGEYVVVITTPNGLTVYGFVDELEQYIITRQDYMLLQTGDPKPTVALTGRVRMRGITPKLTQINREMITLNAAKARKTRQHVQPPELIENFTEQHHKRADKALSYHNMFHCANPILFHMLTHRTVEGIDCEPGDLALMTQKYGPCPACIAGKYTKQSFNHDSNNEPATEMGGCVHCDIYIVYDADSSAYVLFLISVDEVSGYLMLIKLMSKKYNDLCNGFFILEAQYKLCEHPIKVMQTDSEVCFTACKHYLALRGIELRQVPPQQHAQRIERQVRTVNDRVRTILCAQDYFIPTKLYEFLLYYVVDILNGLPNSKQEYPPEYLFTGKRRDYSKRFLAPFGTLGIASTAGRDSQHTTESRGQLGLILNSVSESYACTHFYCFESMDVIRTNNFKPLTSPTEIAIPLVAKRAPLQIRTNLIMLFKDPSLVYSERLKDNLPVTTMESEHRYFGPSVAIDNVTSIGHVDTSILISDTATTVSDLSTSTSSFAREGVSAIASKKTKTTGNRSNNNNKVRAQLKVQGAMLPKKKLTIQQRNLVNNIPLRSERFRHVTQPSVLNNTSSSTVQLENVNRSADNNEFNSTTTNDNSTIQLLEPTIDCDTENITNNNDNNSESVNTVQAETQRVLGKIMQSNDEKLRKIASDVNPSRQSLRLMRRKMLKATSKHLRQIAIAYRISIKEALKSDRAQETKEACIEEIQNMLHYAVGHYIHAKDIPRDGWDNMIHSFMFIKHKEKPNGDYDKTKARLVGNGALQKDHTYDLISSSTVALSTVFMLFNIASYFKAELASYDVKGAFLKAEVGPNDPVTYLKINPEVTDIWTGVDPSAKKFITKKGELILQLDKFIYGLKQSPYKFQKHLQTFFKKLGYKQCENDDCLFFKRVQELWSILSTHVDDILQVSNGKQLVKELHEALIEEYKSITFHEDADAYIGMTIERSIDRSEIKLSQQGLIDKICEKYISKDNQRCSTPCSDELFHHNQKKEDKPMDKKEYLSLVMTLMYLARLTRVDILLPTTFLATKSQNASVDDFKEALKVCRYLKTTRDLGITIKCNDLQLHVHCDASHQVHANTAGHTGYVIGFGSSMSYLHARSGKQKMESLSSTDAEIYAMTECTKTVKWMRNLLSELDLTPLRPIILHEDNAAR